MDTVRSTVWPATHTPIRNGTASKGLISALEITLSLYERLALLASDSHTVRELQALEVEKKTQQMHLRTLAPHRPILEVTLSELLWQRFDDIAASVAGAGQVLTEAEVLAFAMSTEEAVWQAYVQASLRVEDRRDRLLATQLSEQQAQSIRSVAARIRHLRHMKTGFSGHAVQ